MESTPSLETARKPADLNLLLEWPDRHSRGGWIAIVCASLAVNILFISVANQMSEPRRAARSTQRRVIVKKTPLYFPRDLLTQKAPNTRTPNKNIDLSSLLASQAARPRPSAPEPSARHFEVPKTVVKPLQTARNSPQITASAPDITTNQTQEVLPPGAATGLPSNAPPPPNPAPQPFQNVGSEPLENNHQLAVPKASVQSAIQSLAQTQNGSHLVITDDSPTRPMLGAPGSTGQTAAQHSAVELQSDPQGADFRQYLAQILSIVRTNWRLVLPQSVRMGTVRGRTVIEFAIDRDGRIPKLVTANPSGLEALDKAAIAGLVMSSPLPPLPADYKGVQVRLAFTFSYNLPSQ